MHNELLTAVEVIDRQIDQLQEAKRLLELVMNGNSTNANKGGTIRGYKMSQEGRAKIAEAQRQRWAREKAKKAK
jgi:hypothetical protein